MANPDDAEDQDTERRFWAMKAHEETLEGMMSPLALANQIAQTIANAKAAGGQAWSFRVGQGLGSV